MTREYGNRRSSRSRRSAPQQLIVIIITFILGYLSASYFDIQMITQWVNNQVLAHHEVTKEVKHEQPQQAAIPPKPKFEFYTLLANEKVPNSQPTANATQPTSAANTTLATTNAGATNPAPNQTMKANLAVTNAVKPNELKIQQPNIIADKRTTAGINSATTQAATGKGNFLVQVASFKARQDAENMKGRLILKGFNVYIIPVNHATKGNWFRVVVGPYGNRVIAQQAQVSLAKNEHLNGMITTGG